MTRCRRGAEVRKSIALQKSIAFSKQKTPTFSVCGGLLPGRTLKAVIPGGSSTPPLRWETAVDCTMDAETLREAGSSMGTAGLAFLDETGTRIRYERYYHNSAPRPVRTR